MDNYINSNEDILSKTTDFFDFLDMFKEQCKDGINNIEDELKQFQLPYQNRASRRAFLNSSIYKTYSYRLARLKSFQVLADKIKDAYENEIPLISNEDYDNLIMLLSIFNSASPESITSFTKEFIKIFVLISKETNIDLKFLRYFDENGNVKIDDCINLLYYIKNVYENFKNDGIIKVSEESFLDIIVSSEDIEAANRVIKERQEQEKLHREELKRKLQEQKNSNKALRVREENKTVKNNKYTPTPEEIKVKEFYDIELHELKPDCYKKISLADLLKLIEPFITEKSLYNKCVADYQKQKTQGRFDVIKRILRKEGKDLETLLSSVDDSNVAKMEFDDFIATDNFESLSNDEIKQVVLPLIKQMIAPNNNIVNFIVFPTPEFIETQKENIYFSKTHANYETIIKSADTQLRALQSNSLEQMRSNSYAPFHELKDSSYSSFVIEKKLKGYRYGHGTAKICFFTISVHEDNQAILRDKYNWGPNSKVLLVFDVSNINIKEEKTIYIDAIKYATDNKDRLLEIYDIFANPFTKDTYPIALELIENGMKEIREFNSSKTL